MKRLFFLLVLAGLAAAYTGTSTSYQAELAVVDGASPMLATSASYQLGVGVGYLSGDLDAAALASNPGIGFARSINAHPESSTLTEPGTTTCCGPFTFTSKWTDAAGLGLDYVVFESNLGNQTATLTSGTSHDGTYSVTLSTGAGGLTYRWYGVNKDNLHNFTAEQTFTVTPAAAGSGGSTATPAPAASTTPSTATATPALLPPYTGSSTVTPTPGPDVKNFGEARFGSSQAQVQFGSDQTSFTFWFTANADGRYTVTQRIPGIDLSDVDAGLVSFDPEPMSLESGSVVASWDVSLQAGQVFEAQVDVSKPLPETVLDELKAPVVKSEFDASSGGSTPQGGESPSEAPSATPAAASDNTLWFIVGALVLLGIGYFALMGGKSKKKGL